MRNLRSTKEEILTLQQSSQVLLEVCDRDSSSYGSCVSAFIVDFEQVFETRK